jgi:hypothetical protein
MGIDRPVRLMGFAAARLAVDSFRLSLSAHACRIGDRPDGDRNGPY